jgi:predicted outer membrane repeat protein
MKDNQAPIGIFITQQYDNVSPPALTSSIIISDSFFTLGSSQVTLFLETRLEVNVVLQACTFSYIQTPGLEQEARTIHINGSKVSLSVFNSTFSNLRTGNAINLNTQRHLTLNNSVFCHNQVISASVSVTGESSVDIYNCSFINNTAFGLGGALYLDKIFQLRVMYSHFHSNVAALGGAMYLSYYIGPENLGREVTYVWFNSSFIANKAQNKYGGGAFYVMSVTSSPAEYTFIQCHFQNNEAVMDKGGVCSLQLYTMLSESTLTFRDCIMLNNRAASKGGVVYVQPFENYTSLVKIKVLNCTLLSNRAGVGGVMFIEPLQNLSFMAQNSTFAGNSAQRGSVVGAILSEKSFINLTLCIFDENVAAYAGGALTLLPSKNSQLVLVVSQCNFSSNRAPTGSILFVQPQIETITLNQSNIVSLNDVIVSNSGDGMWMYLSKETSLSLQKLRVDKQLLSLGSEASLENEAQIVTFSGKVFDLVLVIPTNLVSHLDIGMLFELVPVTNVSSAVPVYASAMEETVIFKRFQVYGSPGRVTYRLNSIKANGERGFVKNVFIQIISCPPNWYLFMLPSDPLPACYESRK